MFALVKLIHSFKRRYALFLATLNTKDSSNSISIHEGFDKKKVAARQM